MSQSIGPLSNRAAYDSQRKTTHLQKRHSTTEPLTVVSAHTTQLTQKLLNRRTAYRSQRKTIQPEQHHSQLFYYTDRYGRRLSGVAQVEWSCADYGKRFCG